jgi:thioredoxin
MKRLFIVLACATLLAACGNNKKEESKQENEKPKSEQQVAACITLDTEGFVQKVADINNPEWKYLGDKPAIVDFYADWCGPCKAIAPILEEIAKEKAGQIYVYKVNIDYSPEVSAAFRVSGIPTLLFIPMDDEPQVVVGGIGKADIEKKIAEILK